MGEQYRRSKGLKISLLHRKETWVLTLQGWGLLLVCALASLTLAITTVHPFLAPTNPIKADALVIEGWLPDYALETALQEFKRGSYQTLITVGGPLQRGFYLSEYKSYANLSAATLLTLGSDPDQLIAVPTPGVIKGRTNASAEEFKRWLTVSGQNIHSVNLFSLGAHARRSWLSFRRMLAPQVKVGIIAVEPNSYDTNRWWESSEGVRTVLSELLAYVYERFFD